MRDLTPGRVDRAIAALLAPETPARAQVHVDLSAFSTNRIPVAFEDCAPVPAIGDLVDAVDETSRQAATADVVGIDERDHVIRIAVDWTSLQALA
jgi:hypothetical protein